MEVLLEYKDSRIVVKVGEEEDPLVKMRQEAEALLDEDISGCQFQRWSEKWKCYVNIVCSSDVRDGDKIITLIKKTVEDTQEIGKRGANLCKKIKKPSEADARVLSALFSSSSTQKRENPDMFDPTAECVATLSQKKKKKSIRFRSTKITVLMVDPNKAVPRGKSRHKLKDEGYEEIIEIKRNMSSSNIQNAISTAFGTLNYRILCVQDGKFIANTNQRPTGDEVVEIITKRKSPMYICCDVDSDSDLPASNVTKSSSSSTNTVAQSNGEVISISDSDHTEEYVHDYQHEEWRQVREEQDLAYEQSLLADRQKDLEKSNKAKKTKELEEMRSRFLAKFSGRSGSTFVRFRLPNGNRLQNAFLPDDHPKVLYEYIFANGISKPFIIVKTPPRTEIRPDCTKSLVDLNIESCILIVEMDDAAPDPHSYLIDNLDSKNAVILVDIKDAKEAIGILENAAQDREQFIGTLRIAESNGLVHQVNRSDIYSSVLKLYLDEEVTMQFPLRVSFEGEKAIDVGGVYRDMLSAFWEEAYCHLFDGGCLLSPALHPQMDMSTFPIIGRIISHGYLSSGFLPVRVALPSLAFLLFGAKVEIHDVLVQTFLDTISAVEASFLRKVLETPNNFTQEQLVRLTSILSRFGCRQQPTPQSLCHQIIQAAQYEYLIKPSAGLQAIAAGIPTSHQQFWKKQSISGFCAVYLALTASPEKVIQSISEPFFDDRNQERVYGYLVQFIGNMKLSDIRSFLRFVTGSSVCVAQPIHIRFNNLSGLGRRPISHTCNCELELPCSYTTYWEFSHEFYVVLSHDDAWKMDAI